MPSRSALARRAQTSTQLLDPDAQKQKDQDNFRSYCDNPINDAPRVAKRTQKNREQLWNYWVKFCRDVTHVDPYECWINLVERPKEGPTQAPFRTFLRSYIESSKQSVIVLDERERADVRRVGTVGSAIEIWRRIVAKGDEIVLRPRRIDHESSKKWLLRWDLRETHCREGPAFFITEWIRHELGPSLELAFPDYEKVGFTAADVKVLLKTLWERAEDIPCRPLTRVSFHAFVVLAALGGFRPGTLTNLKLSQFKVAVVRNPKRKDEKSIVVTASIRRNKLKLSSNVTAAQPIYISFSFLFVPDSIFCLASLILARAIQLNAFRDGFRTTDEILDAPNLNGSDYLALPWRDDKMDEILFPISYPTIRGLWMRTLLVAGYQDIPRVYALRVGAGGRFDGVLRPSMRNWIMSHTTNVFENSYQTARFRDDLYNLALNTSADHSKATFESLCNTSLSRDTCAPISLTEDEMAQWDTRQDVTRLRTMISEAEGHDKRKLQARLRSLHAALEELELDRKRSEYFEHTTALRARGIRPETVSPEQARATRPENSVLRFLCLVFGPSYLCNTNKTGCCQNAQSPRN